MESVAFILATFPKHFNVYINVNKISSNISVLLLKNNIYSFSSRVLIYSKCNVSCIPSFLLYYIIAIGYAYDVLVYVRIHGRNVFII